MITIDLTILDNEQEALAKVTEALAQVYFDHVLDKDYNIEPIEKSYSIAFNLCPNYRLYFVGKKHIYQNLTKEKAEITSLPLSYPRPTMPIKNDFEIRLELLRLWMERWLTFWPNKDQIKYTQFSFGVMQNAQGIQSFDQLTNRYFSACKK